MNLRRITRNLGLGAWTVVIALACGMAGAEATPAGAAAGPTPRAAAPVPPVRTALGDQPLRPAAAAEVRGAESAAAAVTATKPNSMDYPRVVGALGAVIALIFALRWCGKFFFPTAVGRGQSRAVEVLSRSVLAPKQQVLLLRVGRRVVVVGDTGAQMNTLCEICDPDEVAGLVGQLREEKATAATAFGSLFGRFNRRFEAGEEAAEQAGEPASASGSTSSALLEDAPEEPTVASAQSELDGLRERVRMLSEQFR